VGVESSPLIAAIVHWGIKKHVKGPVWLKQALDRIEIVSGDHLHFLKNRPDNSFDIVYFDPMFRHPINASQPISRLRQLANHEPLTMEAFNEAIRVSRKLVVVKERQESSEFAWLGLKRFVAGKYSEIAYGILDVDEICKVGKDPC
jgi:16S rRNA G966 N2-methylase RsmD